MKSLTVIFSFNSPRYTHRCYNELLIGNPSWNELLVLDNSSRKSVARTPHTTWIGDGNIGHGGMIDWVLRQDLEQYDYVGMINNDTHGYAPGFVKRLLSYVDSRTGIISPAIHQGGSIWSTMLHDPRVSVRSHNFIETIAPWYSRPLLQQMRKLCPYEYYGQIDRAVSILSCRAGLENLLVHALPITHVTNIDPVNTDVVSDDYQQWIYEVKAWYDSRPEIAGCSDVWPDQINSTDW